MFSGLVVASLCCCFFQKLLAVHHGFFFHSFIGYSSCNIQYKFIIQHKKKKEKKKELTSHARHHP